MKRRRKSLGATTARHEDRAHKWFTSATNNFDRILRNDSYLERPCSVIEHFTDVIVEANVAEVEATHAGHGRQADAAEKLASQATKFQRDAVQACQINSGRLNGARRRKRR